MPTETDTHFNVSILTDAFEFSRRPIKTRDTTLLDMSPGCRHYARGYVSITCTNYGSPFYRTNTHRRSRNVSEPQLISSANYMRESWFTTFTSARTVGDIAHLLGDDEIRTGFEPSRSSTVLLDSPSSSIQSWCCADDGHLPTSLDSLDRYSCHVSQNVDHGDCNIEEDSLYSMDSADHESHPLLLSMPIIPQIKLERKATIRKPEPDPLSDPRHNECFLSPRIRDIRAPTRTTSRRYGRVPPRTALQDAADDDAHPTKGETCGDDVDNDATELACTHSAIEPVLDSPCTSEDEEEPFLKKCADEPAHSNVLFVTIDGADSSPELHGDKLEADIEKLLKWTPAVPKLSKSSHRRSSLNYSISFSSIVHAVADGCASLDLLLRKPKLKTKSKSTTKLRSDGPVPNAHDRSSKWAPREGKIVIKVFVPSTDDIWVFRVPQDVNLTDFTSRVVTKLGFAVSFSGSLWDEPRYYFVTDERFRAWVKGRIRFGRNLPLVAHVHPPLPLVRLNVDGDGCEVWCCA